MWWWQDAGSTALMVLAVIAALWCLVVLVALTVDRVVARGRGHVVPLRSAVHDGRSRRQAA